MGILASAMAGAATSAPQLLYTAPAGGAGANRRATVNLLVTNQGAAAGTFRAWMSKTSTGAAGVLAAEMVECDTPLQAKGAIGNAGEKTMLTLDPGQSIWVGASATSVGFLLHGYEEVA